VVIHLWPAAVRSCAMVDVTLGDWVRLNRWMRSAQRALKVCSMQASGRHVRQRTIEQMVEDLIASTDDMRELGGTKHGPIETLFRSMGRVLHFLCLLRLRVAPLLPVDLWDLVIRRVLDISLSLQPARILRRFGYSADGKIRMAVKPLALPRFCKQDADQLEAMMCSDDWRSFRDVALMLGSSTPSHLDGS